MIRVITAARLHFGLFVPESSPAPWVLSQGEVLPVRRFGGVGLMIREPGLVVRAEPASTWTASGPLADRALLFAQRVVAAVGAAGSPQALTIEQAMPAHSGLGSGTQLGLAVARAIATAWNLPADSVDLARWSGRGLRSGLGLHGFDQGGFLIEAGKSMASGLSLLLARQPFPEDWAILLVQGASPDRMCGTAEQEAFGRLTGRSEVASLARLVLLGLLPALLERDLHTFGMALHEFNRRAGEVFAPIQGGPYASPMLAEQIAALRAAGIPAVGQSSWGPTLFAIVEREQAARHRDHLRRLGLEATLTTAANHGALVTG